MTDFDILEKFGSTNKRLREMFTAKAPAYADKPKNESAEDKKKRLADEEQVRRDVAQRQVIERQVRTRIDEGVMHSLKNYQFYAAADLAWDASPVNKFTMPLILYAQGKVNVQTTANALKGVPGGDDCIKKDDKGQPVSIDMPKFLECHINLVRSVTTRRLAAQANRFTQLFPHYKYEARSTGLVGKCRADVLSQRVEIMGDQFDYRHHDVQCMRDAFLYGHCVDVPRAAWEIEHTWVKKEVAPDLETKNFDVEKEIVREGLSFVNHHPSRVFWDNNYPLASLNTDTGCEFLGLWEVTRFKDIVDNVNFFNTEQIGWSTRFWGEGGIYLNYKAYFDQYATTLTPPCLPKGTTTDPAGENSRQANVGIYSVDQRDASILRVTYYGRVIPKDWGIGDYPFPVWVRLVVASDSTVVFAEWLPSTPAVYLGINESDNRQINISPAHELMAYQDQLTNLFTDMLLVVQGELFKAIGINTDVISDEAQVKMIRAHMTGQNWSGTPLVYEFSLKKLQDMGIKADVPVVVSETRIGQSLTAIFEAMAKLIAMAEKLLAMSPAEQGQPAPREISATEVSEISSTTTSVYSFISSGIDEFRAAKKRMIYESLVCCGQGEVYCPVANRYTEDIIKKAGFKIDTDEQEDFTSQLGTKRHTVIGTTRKLIHDYIFTSRDGAERAVNTQAANTLVQLIGQFINNPTIMAAMGKEKLYEIINEIFRLSGAGIDLNLELKPGEDNALGGDQVKQFQDTLQKIQQALQQLAGHVQQDAQSVQQLQQDQKSNEQHFEVIAKLGKEVQTLVAKSAKESISLNYKDAPEEIKRQIEAAAGFQPATTPTQTPP